MMTELPDMELHIDHIGYAVRSVRQSLPQFEKLGFAFGAIIEDKSRNVSICFGEKDNYRIELISPLSKSEKSPVDGVLKNNGSTPYHICYMSKDMDRDIKRLEDNRFKVITPLAPAVAFEGKNVVFLYHPIVGLIEIVES